MQSGGQTELISPSLSTSGGGSGAYETKFLVANRLADGLLAFIRERLPADPNAVCADGYQVSSLYFDTAKRDTYYRSDGYRRRKFRLRRYGSDSHLFLERKSKSKGLIKKRRTLVSVDELELLRAGEMRQDWKGGWYREQIEQRNLLPAANVTYQRTARVGMTPEGPIRFTVDRNIRCRQAVDATVPLVEQGIELQAGQSIVEMKYRIAMPAVFKGLMYEFALVPNRVSKFRMSMEAVDSDTGGTDNRVQFCTSSMAACG